MQVEVKYCQYEFPLWTPILSRFVVVISNISLRLRLIEQAIGFCSICFKKYALFAFISD